MAHLALGVLGPLQVMLGNELIPPLESAKARALLAFLAVEADHPHRRDALLGLLWPNCPQAAARRSLRQALFDLRQALGDRKAKPPFLLIGRDEIQFNSASDYSLDVTRFNALYGSGRGAVNAAGVGQLEEAVALYRGKFLSEFVLEDCAEFEEWARVHREALHQRALDALVALATYYEQQGDFSATRRQLARQLELDPWREEAHRQLMRVLARQGQTSAALVQFETCKRVLAEELGVEPSAETQAVYEQIRLGTQSPKTELLTSKLSIPPLRPSLVPRPRLVQLLNEGLAARQRVALVSAPAGFGKTTLVVTWLKQIDLPAAWLSLDEADNDLPHFLAYLAAALQQVDEEIGAPLHSVLASPELLRIQKALTACLNEIALRAEPLILVLDDYHLLNGTAILETMKFLVQHQPPQLHLVLTTREDPNLPLARLRARGQLNEIRARDLRFTQQETDAFLRGVMGLDLSAQDVAALEDRTEGWAAGLQLAGLSMQKQENLASFVANFSGSQRHILDYLTDEVIHQQPEDIQAFLLQTAILDRLSGPLCDAVTQRVDSSNVLARLEAANLFVIPLDDKRNWYRYHHLFSDLLRNQLARLHPKMIPELHRRASHWFEENGDIQAAIDQALQDTDLTQAAHLIEQHAMPMLYRAQVPRVVGWFDRLPEAIWQSTPMLCISRAWALVLLQDGTHKREVAQALSAADDALNRLNAEQALRDLVSGHAASIQAYLLPTPAFGGKNSAEIIALHRQAQRLLPVEEKAIRSVNALRIGIGSLVLADLEAARIAFQQALEDGLVGGNLYAAIYGPINLVFITLLTGHLREGLQLCDTYLTRFNQILAGQDFPRVGELYILKGSLLLEFDRQAEAEKLLTEGMDQIRWTSSYDAHKRVHTSLARLHAIRGDRSAMLQTVQALEDGWPQGVIYARALRHRLSLRYWPDDPDVRKQAQMWLDQSGIDFGALAAITCAEPVSEAFFESYLGAVHVLASLANGNRSAYPLENAHAYLSRQAEFAQAHGIVSWVVAIAIARTLLYQAPGQKAHALESLEAGLAVAAPTDLTRIFVDEGAPIQTLLEELKPRLKDEAVKTYADRLLQAFGCRPETPEATEARETLLSERELEVLRCLAKGLTYEEIGKQLFLSLNTVQFHIKNIYGKLQVNRRVQAIDRARGLNLI